MGQLITPSRQLIVGGRGFRKPARPVLDPNHPINRGLVGCWPFGDRASGRTPDICGGNDGIFSGSASLKEAHHGGRSVYLATAAGSDLISCGTPKILGKLFAGYGWVSCWFKPDTTAQNGSIISKILGSSSAGWDVEFNNASGKQINFFVRFSGVNGQWQTPSGGVLSSTWYHLFLIYNSDATANIPVIFLNGKKQTVTTAATPTGSVLDDTTTSTLVFGNVNAANNEMQGWIDGIRLGRGYAPDSAAQLLFSEPYAGIVEQAPRWRVGSAVIPPPATVRASTLAMMGVG